MPLPQYIKTAPGFKNARLSVAYDYHNPPFILPIPENYPGDTTDFLTLKTDVDGKAYVSYYFGNLPNSWYTINVTLPGTGETLSYEINSLSLFDTDIIITDAHYNYPCQDCPSGVMEAITYNQDILYKIYCNRIETQTSKPLIESDTNRDGIFESAYHPVEFVACHYFSDCVIDTILPFYHDSNLKRQTFLDTDQC